MGFAALNRRRVEALNRKSDATPKGSASETMLRYNESPRLLVLHAWPLIHSSFALIIYHSLRLITPFDATILYLSFISARGRRSTVPPAFSTSSHPAAMSQRLIPCSM